MLIHAEGERWRFVPPAGDKAAEVARRPVEPIDQS